MNGDLNSENSLTASLDRILDEYSRSLGLEKLRFSENIKDYLVIDRSKMDALPSSACYEIAVELTQYLLYMQKSINRDKARLEWCKLQMSTILSKEWENQPDYMDIDVRIATAARDNSAMQKLQNLKKILVVRLAELDNVPYNIKYYRDLFEKIGSNKRWDAR